jgi:hypothetical protein
LPGGTLGFCLGTVGVVGTVCLPDFWIILSLSEAEDLPGKKKRLISKARAAKVPPSHQVALLKKSAVLLDPNIEPILPPPNVPANPPPLLDWRRTIIIRNIAIIVTQSTNIVYIL